MPAHGLMNRPVVYLAPATQAAYTVPSSPAGTDTIVFVGPSTLLSDSVRLASGWGADCSVTFICWGIMSGKGGDGGDGGNSGAANPGSAGAQGGHGVFINQNVRTYFRFMGSGFVAGGGGGGGGGSGALGHLGANSPGGGGGGGAGYPGGTHGDGGATSGNPGNDGDGTGGGAGGTGLAQGSDGGAGTGPAGEGYPGGGPVGGAGGPPGAAIYSVGFPAPVILENYDAAHVKGAITTA